MKTMSIRLILVGGFLGAGKTTMLWETARRLAGDGKRTGLITNDQAPELVDTAFLSRTEVGVAEVSGSCFCCDYQGLIDAVAHLAESSNADIVVAEPVGSCTDLSATILQPLKDQKHNRISLAPLTVLADPVRLSRILEGRETDLHPSAAYIYQKQLEESDMILISKADTLERNELDALIKQVNAVFPHARVFSVSAVTGEGLDEWLNEALTAEGAGKRILDVDYDIYAEGEAVLGWLNATLDLEGSADWQAFANDLLSRFSEQMKQQSAAIGHIKLLLESGGSQLIGNITGSSDAVSIRGEAEEAVSARLILNARAEMSPEELESHARDILDASCGDQVRMSVSAWRCLSPGRPTPTHRYEQVVQIGA